MVCVCQQNLGVYRVIVYFTVMFDQPSCFLTFAVLLHLNVFFITCRLVSILHLTITTVLLDICFTCKIIIW